ncbi:ABC-2 transporter permease [Enterococcus sp. AZ194]|uniref:ABC-2 transporter permease n=1 Tax=Enterococcus sp. AZ194 TaxID=2774629 RepID=UPI003F687D23
MGLIVKDLKLMGNQKRFFVMIVFIAIAMSFGTSDTTTPIGFLGLIGSMFTISTISYDETDNGFAFLFTLPISRNIYVLEKYTFGLLTGLLFWLIGTIASFIGALIGGNVDFMGLLLGALGIVPAILFLFAVMTPFQLKYGIEKGRLVMFGVIGGVTVVVFLVIKLIGLLGIDLTVIINKLSTLQVSGFIVGIIVLFVGFYLISLRISLTIMKKKEF